MNVIRAHLGQFGIALAKGVQNVDRLLEAARDLHSAVRPALGMLADQRHDTQARIKEVTTRTGERQSEDALARRLATVPGVGAILSSAFAATTPDMDAFRSARLRGVARSEVVIDAERVFDHVDVLARIPALRSLREVRRSLR